MSVVIVRPDGSAAPTRGAKSWPLAGTSFRGTERADYSAPILGPGYPNVAYATLYRTQVWVHTLVNKLSRAIARLEVEEYELDTTTGHRTQVRGPVRSLFERPYPGGNRFALVEATVAGMAVFGNALWVKWRDQGAPGADVQELWPIPWQYLTVVKGDARPIDAYLYNGPAGRKVFFPEDVVHFKWWSPDGEVGVSPLEPLRNTLMMEDAAQRYAIASFRNANRPSGIVQGDRVLDPKDRKELRGELNAEHGGVDNAFRIAILDAGFKWEAMSHTAQEAEVIAHRRVNREEACAVYDVPPPIVHILDHATFSNVTEQHKMLYQDTLGPIYGNIEQTVQAQLIEAEGYGSRFIAFDITDVTKADNETRARASLQFLLSGTYTPNDLRQLENLPPISDPNADLIYVPSAALPINLVGKTQPAQGAQGAGGNDSGGGGSTGATGSTGGVGGIARSLMLGGLRPGTDEFAKAFGEAMLAEALTKYDDSQPRDDHGRWTATVEHAYNGESTHEFVGPRENIPAHVGSLVSGAEGGAGYVNRVTVEDANGNPVYSYRGDAGGEFVDGSNDEAIVNHQDATDALMSRYGLQTATQDQLANIVDQNPDDPSVQEYVSTYRQLPTDAVERSPNLDRRIGGKEFDPNQPRDEHGRWTGDGATATATRDTTTPDRTLGGGATSFADQAHAALVNQGGFSLARDGSQITDANYISAVAGHETVLDAQSFSAKDLAAYHDAKAGVLASDSALFIGGWRDESSGKVYLDLSRDEFASKEEAVQFGKENGQLAIWDAKSQTEVRLDGKRRRKAHESPESRKMRAMYGHVIEVPDLGTHGALDKAPKSIKRRTVTFSDGTTAVIEEETT